MSKKMLLLLVTVAVLFGGALGATKIYATNTTPSPTLQVGAEFLKPQSSDWYIAIGGLFYLPGGDSNSKTENDLGEVKGSQLNISVEEPFTLSVAITDDAGEKVFEGGLDAYQAFISANSGKYLFDITASIPKTENQKKSYGIFNYNFSAIVKPDPKITVGSATIVQGDVFPIHVTNMPKGVVPTVTSDLGFAKFAKKGTSFSAFIPVGYMKPVGPYKVTVTAGEIQQEFTLQVVAGNFKKQYLTIDTSNPVISEASSPKAYAQYREKMAPLYETADEEQHWDGKFTQPVQGRISTEFGLLRYTNGGTTPRGHSGIDIATATGTPIVSPAPGKVVLSEYLLNTGNTLVIEHGGGLKSYFYHMDSLSVKVGDQLTQGQNVGTVGTTGYSTGPHVHYDIRIGDQSLNPWNLWNGTGGFFQ